MSTVNSKMTALADEIRELSGTTTAKGIDTMTSDVNNANAEITTQTELLEQIAIALEGKASGGGTSEISLQDKTVTPTTATQTVTADVGYDGLSKVIIEAIPSNYIVPSGTLSITENGTHDITNYSAVNVNVSGTGGSGSESESVAALLMNTLVTLDNSIATTLRARACQQCTKLVTVNLPLVTSLGSYAFYQCSGLETVKLPKLTSVSTQVFYGCTKLKHADCGQLANIPAQTFNACSALTELILRKTNAICTLSNVNGVNNSPIGKGTGYIYVPSALIEQYKVATNWSTFAGQFRAIEDYPDICG